MEARAHNVVKRRNRSFLRLVNQDLWLGGTEVGVVVADNGGIEDAPKDSNACSAGMVSGTTTLQHRCRVTVPCRVRCAIRTLSTRDEAPFSSTHIASQRCLMETWAVRLSSAFRYAISTHLKCATPLL